MHLALATGYSKFLQVKGVCPDHTQTKLRPRFVQENEDTSVH